MGKDHDKIVETSVTGSLLNTISLSGIPVKKPAGMCLAPKSTNSSESSLYICDRATDNDSSPSENDGKIFEITASILGSNPSGGGGGGTPSGGDGNFPVAAESDDAEQSSSTVTITGSDLELVTDGSKIQTVGLRFTGVTVPKNATIANAWIQFTADESQSEATALVIEGQAADNPPTFTTSSSNISSRPRTSQSVTWNPAAWGSGDGAGANQKTPSLTSIVQALVNRSGWASGNAMTFIVTGSGHRTAVAYEGNSADAAVLHIEISASNQKPSVSAGPNRTVTLPGPASLDGTVSDDGLPNPPGSVTTQWTNQSGPGTVTFGNANAIDTQATFTMAGTYVLRLTANDGGLSEFAEMQVTVNLPGGGSGSATFDTRIAAGSDDVEQNASGSMGLTSSDIELVYDGNNQVVGLRFLGVTIPKNATITNAWIQFTRDEASADPTALTIAGHAVDNAPAFTSTSGNVSSRAKTGATVSWSPPEWTTADTAGPNQRTSDLKSIVQQLVNRTGWTSGNAMAFIVTGTGRRVARAYESSASAAALLHVEYTP